MDLEEAIIKVLEEEGVVIDRKNRRPYGRLVDVMKDWSIQQVDNLLQNEEKGVFSQDFINGVSFASRRIRQRLEATTRKEQGEDVKQP